MDPISYDDFAKLDIRIGRIEAAERVPETDKLIKCTVDFGELGKRTIVSGIALFRTPEELVGKTLPYIINLEPRVIKGVESQGMLLALSFGENDFSLLVPDKDTPPGSKIK
jgi:methionyl-tRNA synthetase